MCVLLLLYSKEKPEEVVGGSWTPTKRVSGLAG